jgi:hypothetical protein
MSQPVMADTDIVCAQLSAAVQRAVSGDLSGFTDAWVCEVTTISVQPTSDPQATLMQVLLRRGGWRHFVVHVQEVYETR